MTTQKKFDYAQLAEDRLKANMALVDEMNDARKRLSAVLRASGVHPSPNETLGVIVSAVLGVWTALNSLPRLDSNLDLWRLKVSMCETRIAELEAELAQHEDIEALRDAIQAECEADAERKYRSELELAKRENARLRIAKDALVMATVTLDDRRQRESVWWRIKRWLYKGCENDTL